MHLHQAWLNFNMADQLNPNSHSSATQQLSLSVEATTSEVIARILGILEKKYTHTYTHGEGGWRGKGSLCSSIKKTRLQTNYLQFSNFVLVSLWWGKPSTAYPSFCIQPKCRMQIKNSQRFWKINKKGRLWRKSQLEEVTYMEMDFLFFVLPWQQLQSYGWWLKV